MNSSYLALLLLSTTLFTGCDKEEPANIMNPERKLIVDGIITNGPDDNYVRLLLSDNKIYDSLGYQYSSLTVVNNALVIVSDDQGNVDTLNQYHYGYDRLHGSPDNQGDSTIDTEGYYYIKKIKGRPGHTYFLYINYSQKEYRASSFMKDVPQIDSLKFDKTWDPVKSQNYYPPLVSFKKMQTQENYYFFILAVGIWGSNCPESSYEMLDFLTGRTFNMTIIKDANLAPYVSGLDVGKGKAPDYWLTSYTWANPGDTVKIRMFSTSKAGYQYFEALFKQIDNDGGLFNPAPTTPKGNISGGAFGYFGASAVSKIKGTVKAN